MFFLIFLGIFNISNVEDFVEGTEFVDIAYNDKLDFSFITQYPNIFFIAQKTMNLTRYTNPTKNNTYFYNFIVNDYKNIQQFDDNPLYFCPIPLEENFEYHFSFKEEDNENDYLVGFFNGTGCDIIYYTNKENDEMEQAIPKTSKPCFFHLHKYSTIEVSYSNVTKQIEIDQDLINIKIRFGTTQSTGVQYPEIRGIYSFFQYPENDINQNNSFGIALIVFLCVFALAMIFCSLILIIIITKNDKENDNCFCCYYYFIISQNNKF